MRVAPQCLGGGGVGRMCLKREREGDNLDFRLVLTRALHAGGVAVSERAEVTLMRLLRSRVVERSTSAKLCVGP